MAIARIDARWPSIARDGLIATGGVCFLFGVFAIVATSVSSDPDISHVFVAGAIALLVVGTALMLRVGERFVSAVLTSLTGGSFALVLADMTSTPIDAPDRYSSLRWVILLAMTLIGLLVFQEGFRSHESEPESVKPPQPAVRKRTTRPSNGKGRRPRD